METACTLGGDDYEKFPWDEIAKLLEELQDTELRDEIAKEIQIEGSIDEYSTTDIGLKIRESCSQSQSSYQEIMLENAKLACYDETMYQVLNEANVVRGCVTQALDKVIDRVEEKRKKEKDGGQIKGTHRHWDWRHLDLRLLLQAEAQTPPPGGLGREVENYPTPTAQFLIRPYPWVSF